MSRFSLLLARQASSSLPSSLGEYFSRQVHPTNIARPLALRPHWHQFTFFVHSTPGISGVPDSKCQNRGGVEREGALVGRCGEPCRRGCGSEGWAEALADSLWLHSMLRLVVVAWQRVGMSSSHFAVDWIHLWCLHTLPRNLHAFTQRQCTPRGNSAHGPSHVFERAAQSMPSSSREAFTA